MNSQIVLSICGSGEECWNHGVTNRQQDRRREADMTKEILIVSMACWAIGILTGVYVMRRIYKTKAKKAMEECERYMKHITTTIRDTMVLKSKIEVPIVAEVT